MLVRALAVLRHGSALLGAAARVRVRQVPPAGMAQGGRRESATTAAVWAWQRQLRAQAAYVAMRQMMRKVRGVQPKVSVIKPGLQ